MKKYFQCKVELHYNTKSKAVPLEVIIEAETESEAHDGVMAYYHDIILHPKKTVYVYNKEQENYLPVECDAEENDSRVISVDILSVKLSNICCFWGNPKGRIYIIKVSIDFISVKSMQQIAIGANSFKEVCAVLSESFEDSRNIAQQLVIEEHLKCITDYDYEHFSYDVTSLQRSKIGFISIDD